MKVFGIHGGGNIGLGLLAEIINRCKEEYQIVATSNDGCLTQIVNKEKKFSLLHKPTTAPTQIKNVTMISRSISNVKKLYLKADVVAICLTQEGLQASLEGIARGLIARFKKDAGPLNILVLMNVPDSHVYVRSKLKEFFLKKHLPAEVIEWILLKAKFIPTMVDRIVRKLSPEEMIKHLTNVFPRETITTLDDAVNVAGKNKYPIPLFQAEKNFVLYVSDTFPLVTQFPDMKPTNSLKVIDEIKNKYINGPHAILRSLILILL